MDMNMAIGRRLRRLVFSFVIGLALITNGHSWISPTGQITIKLESWLDTDLDGAADSGDTTTTWTVVNTSLIDETIFDTQMSGVAVEDATWRTLIDSATTKVGQITTDSAFVYGSTIASLPIKCVVEGSSTWTDRGEVVTNIEGQGNPSIAVENDGTIHMVWVEDNGANAQINYAYSIDDGATWTDRGIISSDTLNQRYADIAVESDSTIHVAWSGDYNPNTGAVEDIYYSFSTDDGATWTDRGVIIASTDNQSAPKMAVESDGTIHLIWTEGGYVYYSLSTNNGSTWSVKKSIGLGGESGDIVVESDSTIHVVWTTTEGLKQVYYAYSTDDGANWTNQGKVASSSLSQYSPVITIESDSTIHVAWKEQVTAGLSFGLINYAFSSNDGTDWTDKGTVFYKSNTYQNNPDIVVGTGSKIHIVWIERANSTTAKNQIYYAYSTDDGATWANEGAIVSSSEHQTNAKIAIESGGTLHVVWQETSGSADQINYAFSSDTTTNTKTILTDTWTTSGGYYLFRYYVVDGRDNRTNMEYSGLDMHVLTGTNALMEYSGDTALGVSDAEIQLVRINRKPGTPVTIGVE